MVADADGLVARVGTLAHAADLDALLDPGYLGDLEARPIDEVRAMRAECQEVETGLSLLRRMVQGRLDIVGVRARPPRRGRRPGDLPDLIARLPEVLADRTHAPGVGRLPQLMAPGELARGARGRARRASSAPVAWPTCRRVDDDRRSARWPTSSRPSRRRSRATASDLFERIDALQAEITRRYRTGEATRRLAAPVAVRSRSTNGCSRQSRSLPAREGGARAPLARPRRVHPRAAAASGTSRCASCPSWRASRTPT